MREFDFSNSAVFGNFYLSDLSTLDGKTFFSSFMGVFSAGFGKCFWRK